MSAPTIPAEIHTDLTLTGRIDALASIVELSVECGAPRKVYFHAEAGLLLIDVDTETDFHRWCSQVGAKWFGMTEGRIAQGGRIGDWNVSLWWPRGETS